jgi:hypothetical protein
MMRGRPVAGDLTVSLLSISTTNVTFGSSFTVTVRINYVGPPLSFLDYFYFDVYQSVDSFIDPNSDIGTGSATFISGPASGNFSVDHTFTVYAEILGNISIGAFVDYTDLVIETSESNNASNVVSVQVTSGSISAGALSISDVLVTEGDSGTKVATFSVTRSGGSSAFAVNYATSNGSATLADGDYVGKQGTLNFGIGESIQTISVTINGDTKIEPNESFFVTLSGGTNGVSISKATGTGTIENDDSPTNHTWTLATLSPTVAEGSAATFRISRSGSSIQETIYFSTTMTGGSKNDPLNPDYDGKRNLAVTFAVGQLTADVVVQTFSDSIIEGNETFGAIVQSAATVSANPDALTPTLAPAVNFTITDVSPDYTASGLTLGSASVEQGSSITFNLNVNNVGNGGGQAGASALYLSTDATITSADISSGTLGVGFLAAGQTQSYNGYLLQFPANFPIGTYYLGVIVNSSGVLESNVNNNVSNVVAISVTGPGGFTDGPNYVALSAPGRVWNALGGNDTVFGTTGADTIDGGGGNDTIYGISGNNVVRGGGGYDKAAYGLAASFITIEHNADGTKTISGPGFTDTISNVEVAEFAGGVKISLQERSNRADVGADGRSDILLRNSADGSVYVWEVNGTALTGQGYVGWTPGAVWKTRGTGDFNGDGKSDILLQNADTGQSFVWIVNGLGAVDASSGFVGWTPGAEWVARGSGDFNGDGKSDILLQNALTGQCFTFMLNGTTVIGNGFIGGAVGAEWVARATGDFNGDGKSDIVFQSTLTGQNYIWNLDGANVVSHGFAGWAAGANWVTRGTGDFSGDGRSDILMQDTTNGQCFTFIVEGTAAVDARYIGGAVTSVWAAKGTGDFNGDGKSDILFQNTGSGAAYVWHLDGTAVTTHGYVGWTPGAQWEAVA